MNKQPIGVFDSGVGGLSILRELHRLLPGEDYIFLADQTHVPYGEKSQTQLIRLACRIADFFVSRNAKLMVVACNTSTCYAIDALREKYSFPIVGTVPAVKPACERTKTGVTAILSTPATAKSKTLKGLIDKYGRGIQVINIGCKNLEDEVENGNLNAVKIKKLLAKYLAPIKNSKADQVVLGCTHYPFLKQSIQELLGPSVKLVDSGAAIARRTKALLTSYKINGNHSKYGKTAYFTTGDAQKFAGAASVLLKCSIAADRITLK